MKRTNSHVDGSQPKKKNFGKLLSSFKTSKVKKTPIETTSVISEPKLGFVDVECQRSKEVKPRTLWSFWHTGAESMPSFYKMCVKSWKLRLNCEPSTQWDIRILNLIEGHEDNIFQFISKSDLPDSFMKIYLRQHQSDLVRLALLDLFGGVWCDVSILMFESIEPLWRHINVNIPLSQKCSMDSDLVEDSSAANQVGGIAHFFFKDFGTSEYERKDFVEVWFIAVSKPHHIFIQSWRAAMMEYWGNGRTASTGLASNPFFASAKIAEGPIPGWGWDYLSMSHCYKKLISEQPYMRELWNGSSSNRNTLPCFTLLDSQAPFFCRIALGLKKLNSSGPNSLLHTDDEQSSRRILRATPMLKFTSNFVGDSKSLDETRLFAHPSTLQRLFHHAFRDEHMAASSSHEQSKSWEHLIADNSNQT
mmetsp:Transcript_16832/g.21848  ORF Transcript_16832/g.21848 Transcript_16832/m.21848 type:complete len:419 (+) Transcript_16832:91-1347(+)